LDLKADRLSCHRFLANQFRLLLHTAADCLFWLLRRYLQGTELATAQVNTLRLKLLKIGARIRETGRRIWVHLASSYPYRDLQPYLIFGSLPFPQILGRDTSKISPGTPSGQAVTPKTYFETPSLFSQTLRLLLNFKKTP